MRRIRPQFMLILALASGVVAAVLALRYLQTRTPTASAEESARTALVLATRALPAGTVIGPQDVTTIPWRGGRMPAGYLATPEQAIGRGVTTPLALNEPLLEGKLAPKGAGGGLAIMIEEGKRAVSVKVDEVIGVAGFVLPNTRVDVLSTVSRGGDLEKSTSRVILQNVRTLAAGSSVEQDAAGKPKTVTVITLLVTPEEAELLTLAANQGRLQLALRNGLDTLATDTKGVSGPFLQSGVTAPAAAPVRRIARSAPPSPAPEENRPTAIVESYKGGVRALTTFEQR